MGKVVAVGMSGGVDSSLTAALLKEQGYDVFGIFMKNWEEKDPLSGQCSATKDKEDVEKVCHLLDIPIYTVNFSKQYFDKVFTSLLEGLKKGVTPNPDILCNKEIKFDLFLKKALSLGADYLATGHYCQNIYQDEDYILQKGADQNKDQTYFTYTLQQEQLKFLKFPIGHLSKKNVRQEAEKRKIPTYSKKDSTGICFIGKRDFSSFISNYIPCQPGSIIDIDTGKVIGEHIGAFFYTIGQRKGLRIGGEGDAWFVTDKNLRKNQVFVAQGHNHPSLMKDSIVVSDLSWTTTKPPNFPLNCEVKIRYRTDSCSCVINESSEGKLIIQFTSPQRAVTPGQSAVFYKKNHCIGGGTILQ